MKKIKMFLYLAMLLSPLVQSTAQSFSPSGEKSSIQFTIKNFGLNVEGSFSGLAGFIKFDRNHIESSSFDVTIESSSIDTGVGLRDKHLKKEEFFDVSTYPYIKFISTKITAGDKPNTFIVTGKLTIKKVTREIQFPFTADLKSAGVFFAGGFKIDRRDFKVGGNSLSMGDIVEVNLAVLAEEIARP